MIEHGGNLRSAAKQYNIPLESWIDLSTGINPNGWPIVRIPDECWQRLPENTDGLLSAAQQYYRNTSILPVAGSQAAIQILPRLRATSRVGVLTPTYAEHAANWQKAAHTVIEIDSTAIEEQIAHLDVLILVNPNNPTGQTFKREQLLRWHNLLKKRQGWLVIDEAYIDPSRQNSLSDYPVQEGLIILRSIGKFFGLAGIRCGFVIGSPKLLNNLNEELGPWNISHPARYIAKAALQDRPWQQQTCQTLPMQALRLKQLLSKYGLPPEGGAALFQWVKTEQAADIHHFLASQGVLTRLFTHPSSLRFGLPANNSQWLLLESLLKAYFSVSLYFTPTVF